MENLELIESWGRSIEQRSGMERQLARVIASVAHLSGPTNLDWDWLGAAHILSQRKSDAEIEAATLGQIHRWLSEAR